MFIATSLTHYKNKHVQAAIVAHAQDKEVSVMYGVSKFGKRPDVLSYNQDVMEFAKKKATSFHCSEELWTNPLSIVTGMKRHELDELRLGWDLILDIDCPDWDLSRLTAHLFIKALLDHGIKNVSVKFSGNKGFHIGVPFESFPDSVSFGGEMRLTKDLFPEGPRKIALYLLSYITEHYIDIEEESILIDGKHRYSIEKLKTISSSVLVANQCLDCAKVYEPNNKQTLSYQCSKCGYNNFPKGNPEIIRCNSCGHPVSASVSRRGCPKCSSQKYEKKLNLLSVIEVDTVLIASRHMYRMPYSLHEKSGLISLPIPLDSVLSFEKETAKPERVSFDVIFIDRSKSRQGEANKLLAEALSKELQELSYVPDQEVVKRTMKKIEIPTTAIPEKYFPPCIQLILQGLEDGKKRALFILINFLRTAGYLPDQIEELVHEWNEKNPEPLHESYIRGQLFQLKKGKAVLPPPNCNNKDYYNSLLICKPDGFCRRIKNPAMYSKRKAELDQNSKKRKSNKKTKKKGEKASKDEKKTK